METLLASQYFAAAIAFIAMALAIVALALFWEGARTIRRRKSVGRELKKLTGQEYSLDRRDSSALLKEDRGQLPPWLEPIAARVPRLGDAQLMLEQARSSWSVGTFFLLTGGFALALGTIATVFTGNGLVGLAAAGLGASIPYMMVARQRAKRLAAFEEQFPEVIDLLARSARAGHALQAGLQEVAEEAPDPCGEEFRQVFEEQRFGLQLGESLLGLGDRIDVVDVRMFVTSVMIQKETGGNLAENLDNLSRLIRARFRFKRQINTHSAHGRMTGLVLGLAPIVAAILLYLLNPDYMKLLFTEDLGRLLLGIGLFLQLVGFYVIRRMTQIEY
jgi:tight adherence protein B